MIVDRFDHPAGGGKIGGVQFQANLVVLAQVRRYCALYRGAGRNFANRKVIDLHLRAARSRTHTANEHVTLGHGVHLAVGALQRRHHQRAAAQTFGVTDGRHGNVDGLARLGKCWQRSGHHHSGYVLQLQAGAGRQIDALCLQHRHNGLHRERRLRGLVAAAVQAHDNAVAAQLILAYAGNRGQVFQAFGAGSLRQHQAGDQGGDQGGKEYRSGSRKETGKQGAHGGSHQKGSRDWKKRDTMAVTSAR